jgi:hypothetical protein
MKTILLISGLLIVIAGAASAELETVWMHTYGGASADGFRQAIPTGDGGFVAVGYTYSFGSGDVDVFLVKTDSAGDTLWARAYGGPSLDYGHSVCQTDNGDYVLAGYTMSYGSGGEDVYLIRVDSAGDTVWARTYGGAQLDDAKGVCFTSDGCIVVAGQTESFGAGLSDVYLLKIDGAGDTLWTRAFGSTDSDWAMSVCELADGAYGVSGSTGSISATRDAYLLKVDAGGNLVWDYNYGSTEDYMQDYGAGAIALADSGIVATGWRTDQYRGDPLQAGFLRVDGIGVQQSYRKYAEPYYEYGSSVCETADDGFLICGSNKNSSTHRNDLFLVKRVQGSGWVWDQTLGGDGSDWGCSVVEVEPGNYLVAGYTESWGSGSFDGWLIKMKEEDASAPDRAGVGSALYLAAPSPNPFRPMASLRFTVASATHVDLSIFDVTGRRVAVLREGYTEPGEYTATWHGRDSVGAEVSPGVYLVRLAAGDEVVARKLVRLK